MHCANSKNTKARILFVDDSKLMRLSGQKILAETFDIVLAENAIQAQEILEADPMIQVVFSDLNMPGKSGYEFLGDLRQSGDKRLGSLPVIIITGAENQETERQRALKAGATDFISKPFKASELMARAQAHASHKEAERRLHELQQSHQTDSATGIGSRHYCLQRLGQAISFARRHGQDLSLIHLHLDGLQALCQELGEPFASSAWKKIGEVLKSSIRHEDTVYRTGEESFCFMLPATDTQGAAVLRDRFMPDLEALGLQPNGETLNVRCEFSIQAVTLDTGVDVEALLDRGLREPRRTVVAVDTGVSPIDIEQALAMIERGELTDLQPHLDSLTRRLEPLLRLAGQRLSADPQLARTGTE